MKNYYKQRLKTLFSYDIQPYSREKEFDELIAEIENDESANESQLSILKEMKKITFENFYKWYIGESQLTPKSSAFEVIKTYIESKTENTDMENQNKTELKNIADPVALDTLVSVASGWQKERPTFPCVVLGRIKWDRKENWEYSLWRFEMIDGNDADGYKAQYLGWCNNDGEEYGDLADLKEDEFLIIEKL